MTNLKFRFEAFIDLLESSSICSRAERVGCTEEEISELEHLYLVSLPESYRLFLRNFGKHAGKLFENDVYGWNYESVLTLTNDYRDFLNNLDEEDGTDELDQFDAILGGGLLINERYMQDFNFIQCDDPDDTPVFLLRENGQVSKIADSVLEWLDLARQETERAIQSGYFEKKASGNW